MYVGDPSWIKKFELQPAEALPSLESQYLQICGPKSFISTEAWLAGCGQEVNTLLRSNQLAEQEEGGTSAHHLPVD